MLALAAGSLVAAQVLGIVGLVRPGYEVLVAIGMALLLLPVLMVTLTVALTV